MMREDFELGSGLEDYVRTFTERAQLPVTFESHGAAIRLSSDAQLTLLIVGGGWIENSTP